MTATGSAACPVNIHTLHQRVFTLKPEKRFVISIHSDSEYRPRHKFKCIVALVHSSNRCSLGCQLSPRKISRMDLTVSHMLVLTEPRSSSAATQYHELHITRGITTNPRWQNWGEIKNGRVAERRSKIDQNPLLYTLYTDWYISYPCLHTFLFPLLPLSTC